MNRYAIASIRNKFMEGGHLIYTYKGKRNDKVGSIRATRKLHYFDLIQRIQYINNNNLNEKNIIRLQLCN